MQVKKIKDALKFTPIGEPVGNLTIGRAQLATVTGPQRNCYVAIVENKIASGALGALECQRLGSLFTICMRENAALVLYLDSAGAKVSEGHMALGAFRKLFKHALQMSARNVAVVTVLGTHCYGGASMLAQAGQICLYGAHTKLAMSGPTILAQAAGADVFDASFQAIAQAAIGGSARTALSQRNRILPENIDAKGLEIAVIRAFTDIAAEPNWGAYKHAELKARAQNWGVDKLPVEAFTRDDCDKLFADGYAVQRQGDVIFGTANYHGVLHDVLGIAAPGTRTLGALSAPSAWALAQRALALAGASAGASTGAGHLGANSKPCLILLD